MRLSLGRAMADQAVDEVFLMQMRAAVAAALADGDTGRFAAAVGDLHSARLEASQIIDSNFPR